MLDAAREGDREAYAELFRRHRDAAVRFGVRLTGDVSTAHDLVSEAFIKLMSQLDRGTGPDGRPLAYLIATMRNLHVDQYRRHGCEVPTAEVVGTRLETPACDESDRLVEGDVVARAFASLPENYRMVLWYTEVLGRPLSEVAEAFGASKNAVGVQAFRARESLREAYLAEHLGTVKNETCRTQVRLIPKYVRGSLSEKKCRQLEQHLPTCASCAAVLHNLRRMNTDLSVLVLPAIALGAMRFSSEGVASSPSVTSTTTAWRRAGAVGLGLGLVAAAVLAVRSSDDQQAPGGPPEPRTTTVVPPPTMSPSARVQPDPPRTSSPAAEPTIVPTTAAPPAPVPTATQTPSPQPTVPTEPSPARPATRMSAPYITVARSSGGAALRLLSRITGLTRGTTITLAATNVTAPDTAELDGWRCTQVQARPDALRLSCRATRTATPLYSVGLSFVDPETAVSGTVGLGDRSQTLSFVATA